jgi:RNA polymerase sigma-70 factor, ECF subfamily
MNSNCQETAFRIMDFQLVRRAQNGDGGAFAKLFQTHKGRIYSLCLRMTNNGAEAEDLTQDTFVQVFRNLSAFHGKAAFSTWLYRVAINTVLMHFRRNRPFHPSLDARYDKAEGDKPAMREYGVRDGRLDSSVMRVTLGRAISKLPEGARTVFILHAIEGYQHHEVAGFLGCSVGTSKSQLHKAKQKLRNILSAGTRVESEPSDLALAQPEWEVPMAVQVRAGAGLAESTA